MLKIAKKSLFKKIFYAIIKMSTYQSNVTSAFVDLATYDALEAYLYGGDDAVTYFVRQHRKSTWFSQVPVVLSNASGTADFGNQWSVTISRAGDYLLNTWLETNTPTVISTEVVTNVADYNLFWAKNFMHNLVEECTITFNDLIAARFDSTQLDFWSAFTVPASKKSGYRTMTGYGVETLSANGRDSVFLRGVSAEESHKFSLPLPFFYSRESGVALPTAALPYNDMRINFRFRPLSSLLYVYEPAELKAATSATNTHYTGGTAALTGTRVWANYAVVSNDERKLMGTATRDIAIEQMQAAPITSYSTTGNSTYDLRFSHGVKALMFALRAKDPAKEGIVAGVGAVGGIGGDSLSRYDTSSLAELTDGEADSFNRKSPIDNVTLLYENTTRLGSVPSSYFTQVGPYYHAEAIPTDEAGIHMYSYALDLMSVDPCGSTNYGRLTNVSIVPAATEDVTGTTNITNGNNAWDLVVNAINHNIVRISGGALGFPIL